MPPQESLIKFQEEYIKLLERECENQARILLLQLKIKTPHETVVLGEKLRRFIAEEKAKLNGEIHSSRRE